uniref:Uncharacterized protein n=1 Tax=Panstrongylus lignarius TaxID=156445 RepID=A0A224Y2X1_9HEMI
MVARICKRFLLYILVFFLRSLFARICIRFCIFFFHFFTHPLILVEFLLGIFPMSIFFTLILLHFFSMLCLYRFTRLIIFSIFILNLSRFSSVTLIIINFS